MKKANVIAGSVYRVKSTEGEWLVEVPLDQDPIVTLAWFAAEYSVKGYIVTSVTQISNCADGVSPYMPILSSREYEAEVQRLVRLQRGRQNFPQSVEEFMARVKAAGWKYEDVSSMDDCFSFKGRMCFELSKDVGEDEDITILVFGDSVEDFICVLDEKVGHFKANLIHQTRGTDEVYEMYLALDRTVLGL